MISSDEYKIFVLIDQNRTDEIQDFDTLSHMYEKGYVAYTGAKLLYITQKGQRAYEEYKHFIEHEAREKLTLKISKIAIILSAIALIVSIVGVILSAVIC